MHLVKSALREASGDLREKGGNHRARHLLTDAALLPVAERHELEVALLALPFVL